MKMETLATMPIKTTVTRIKYTLLASSMNIVNNNVDHNAIPEAINVLASKW